MENLFGTVKTDPAFCAEYEQRKPDYSRAERRLMQAVLEDAIRCYQGGGYNAGGYVKDLRSRTAKLAEEARRWIFGVEKNDEKMLTFEQICEALSIDSDAFRDKLKLAERLKRKSRQPVNSSLLRIQESRPKRGPRRLAIAL